MSYADKVFKETVRDILDNGTDTKNQEVRPVWEDGTKAYILAPEGLKVGDKIKMMFSNSIYQMESVGKRVYFS